jgi:uncharacterized protein (TIGR03435 family)
MPRFLIVLFVVICLEGQTKSSDVQFEVATARPNTIDRCRGAWDFTQSHGKLTIKNVSLRKVISRAYFLPEDQVSGSAWLESECYDIVGQSGSETSDKVLMLMLQALLKERFHLVVHHESEERAIFALLVDKNGPKVHEYRPGDKVSVPSSIAPGNVFFMISGPMSTLAERLALVVGRPVVDKTSLPGEYKISLSYAPLTAASSADTSVSAGDVFAAVREQLGLKLQSQRGPIEILRVDHAERIPMEN